LARDLGRDGFEIRVVDATASTNDDLAAAARAGAPEGTVLVAESQTAGRGRQGRAWVSPPRSGLTYSVLLRPPAPSGWLPLLTGVALAATLREHAGIEAVLKWPNDVLLPPEEHKVAGILAEVADGAVVIGIGLNISLREEELPDERATSLAIAGATSLDRETLLKAHLRALSRGYAAWRQDPMSAAPLYRALCSTLGRRVSVQLPGGEHVEGTATDIDDEGRLIVDGRVFAAGDVIHLR
jgi:BirA family biotin operon repressor/biotin-[acetyl-CoA-carboxylase] ligase